MTESVPEDLPKQRRSVRDTIADAIVTATMDEVRSVLSRKAPLDSDEFRRFFLSLKDESDRAIPVVALAYVDHLLANLLVEELNPAVPKGPTSLMGPLGPLASASARMRMAQALYWLDDKTSADLNALRRIRNLFAHEPFITFQDPRVLGHLGSIETIGRVREFVIRVEDVSLVPEGFEIERDPTKTDGVLVPPGGRVDFLVAACAVSGRALIEVYLGPTSTRHGLAVRSLLAREDKVPDCVQAMRATLANTATDLLLESGVPVRRKPALEQPGGASS